MLKIAALVPDVRAGGRLRSALKCKAELALFENLKELVLCLRRHRVDVLIVAPWDRLGLAVAPALLEIRKRLPALPIAVYCPLSAKAVREVVALTRAGADEVILQDVDEGSSELWSRLLVSVSRRAAAQALAHLRPFIASEIEPIVSYCLERADERLTVEGVAATFSIHRKTLVNRFAAAGLPSPNQLISWCRLLLAARFLEDPGRSVEQVALTLGFGSGPALRNMIRRHTQLRPSELRALGGWTYLVGVFAAFIASPEPRSR